MSVWLVMIILHATFAVLCFATGFALLSPVRQRRYPWLLRVFIASLVAMIIFMVAATVTHWQDISIAERIVFSGLPLLGIYMLYRGIQAKNNLRRDDLLRYIDDIGFVLIALFNGFIIVALIDLQAPPLLIPLVAIAGTVAGSKYVASTKQKFTGKKD